MYSTAIEKALEACFGAHQGQLRKAGGAPYAVHPAHIALILARWGADEVVIQAGLLHDVVEDCPGWDRARIEREFGARVAAIVAELSEDKSRSWSERKQQGIDHVPHFSHEAVLVKAADVLHNLRTLAGALHNASDPAAVWKGFKGGREATLHMSGGLVAALERRLEPRIARALHSALENLREAAGAPAGA